MTRVYAIATASHLAKTAVLLESVARHHPDWQRFLLLADVTPETLRQCKTKLGPLATLLCCADLDLPEPDLMRRYYDVFEFCCAMKSFGMRHLGRDGEPVLYLDTDMLLLRPFTSLTAPPGGLCVTPHASTPMPRDGQGVSDRELGMSGFVNAGIILAGAHSADSMPAVWLQRHVTAHCFNAPNLGMFVDQSWVSQMATFFPNLVTQCSDPGMNLGHWNLHERPLKTDADGTIRLASGVPLTLVHFSGYPGQGGRLSRYSARRYDEETEAAVASLRRAYEALLEDASRRWPGYSADLSFGTGSIEKRMLMARTHWQDPELPLPETRAQRLRRLRRRYLRF